jgi:hypothetical protein
MSLAKLVQRANELTQVSEPEPVYNYVKGQGWVPSFGTVVTMRCGTVIRIEIRKALKHERYDSGGGFRYRTDGVYDPKKWADAFQRLKYQDLRKVSDYDMETSDDVAVAVLL